MSRRSVPVLQLSLPTHAGTEELMAPIAIDGAIGLAERSFQAA